ncbi:uncharacterized protein [Rutidosis leptorrhynchoides]|uniref:uncharacterized protein n=1 Tax=Rutidosis leptorrhynchoides TaxID=125765 RepID=UPI003A992E3F
MIPTTSPWHFFKWAIDIVGPFPAESGSADYLVVAIDFFTKWVEAKPLNKSQVRRPRKSGDSDLKQKKKNAATEVTKRAGFWVCFSHAEPAGTEQKTAAGGGGDGYRKRSRTVVDGGDSRLQKSCRMVAMRGRYHLEERREKAAAREAINKQRIARYYEKRVRLITYTVGDLVWRDNQASRIGDTRKMGPNWEGPYRVNGISKTGTYKLAELNGKAIKRTWHATELKRCNM